MTSSPSTSIQAWRRTYDAIDEAMVTNTFEGHSMTYLPLNAYKKINDYSRPICNAYPSLKRYKWNIPNTHPKAFLLGIYSNISLKFLAQILGRPDFNDHALPFRRDDLEAHETGPATVAGAATQEVDNVIFWQQSFMATHFKQGSFSQKIPSDAIVPIEGSESSEGIATGNTGRIFRAQIGPSCRKFGESDTFALKRIDDPADAKREVKVVKNLMGRGRTAHKNIASIYSGFTFGGMHYLIMEKAGKDLSKLMKRDPTSQMTPAWVRNQLKGLAEALKMMHKVINGRVIHHHDIKPENILVFASGDRTRLKMTDWGSASAKKFTRSQSPKSTGPANPTYLPPEEAGTEKHTSRPRDVWSLGCLFLELIIWQSQGSRERILFLTGLGSCYWRDKKKSRGFRELHPVVTTKLNELTVGNWKAMIGIIRKMLEVDPKKRINAADLVRKLESIR